MYILNEIFKLVIIIRIYPVNIYLCDVSDVSVCVYTDL